LSILHVAFSLGSQQSAERDINKLSDSVCAGQRNIKIFLFATLTNLFTILNVTDAVLKNDPMQWNILFHAA